MLIRITNHCNMACSHCMIDSGPDGEHMPLEIYKKTLEFSVKYDRFIIFLSGGEPTDHPDFIEYVNLAKHYKNKDKVAQVLVASNGMFLENERYTQEILKLGIPMQITNDPRFYSKRIKKIEHPLLTYVDALILVTPIGRAADKPNIINRQSPLCFNIRSVALHVDNFKGAIEFLRGRMKMCIPSINIDGSLVSGESSSCYKIGTVESTSDEIMESLHSMRCGKCGLYKNLQGQHRDLWNDLENA